MKKELIRLVDKEQDLALKILLLISEVPTLETHSQEQLYLYLRALYGIK